MNIIKSLIARMIEDRGTNKSFPCKTYATEVAAEKAIQQAAIDYPKCLCGEDAAEAQYVVFFVPAWNRWTGAINAGEVLARKNAGGYIGHCPDVYKY